METITAREIDISKGMSYEKYFLLVKQLLEEGKTTGENQSESYLKHAKLNFQRMKRVYRTSKIEQQLEDIVHQVEEPQKWIVLTEGWCGDAAQSLPLMARLSELSANIELVILLRDENPDIMDAYLTNGSRSIPKLISIDSDTGEELFTWGPRPKEFQEMVIENKRNPVVDYDTFQEQLHRNYTTDKTVSLQEELTILISESIKKAV